MAADAKVAEKPENTAFVPLVKWIERGPPKVQPWLTPTEVEKW